MPTQKFLKKIEMYAEQLAQDITKVSFTDAISARFDHTLFNYNGSQLEPYLREITENIEKIKAITDKKNITQLLFLTERLVAQITAFDRELSSCFLRKQEVKQHKNTIQESLYHRFAQNQQYEHRLKSMIQDRYLLLEKSPSSDLQRQQQELAKLEGRLYRCQQALKSLERYIERYEISASKLI